MWVYIDVLAPRHVCSTLATRAQSIPVLDLQQVCDQGVAHQALCEVPLRQFECIRVRRPIHLTHRERATARLVVTSTHQNTTRGFSASVSASSNAEFDFISFFLPFPPSFFLSFFFFWLPWNRGGAFNGNFQGGKGQLSVLYKWGLCCNTLTSTLPR